MGSEMFAIACSVSSVYIAVLLYLSISAVFQPHSSPVPQSLLSRVCGSSNIFHASHVCRPASEYPSSKTMST